MIKQPMATYGLSRSPILANFQNTPSMPDLFLSNKDGYDAWTYVHVHTDKIITRSNEEKLKSAVCR